MPFQELDILVRTGDGRHCVLIEPFIYITNEGERIEVPAGSESDGASTPQFMWDHLPPFGKYFKAAFLHDYLYRYSKKTKESCDLIFLEAMLSLGVDATLAGVMYQGVAIGGWKAFEECRVKRKSK